MLSDPKALEQTLSTLRTILRDWVLLEEKWVGRSDAEQTQEVDTYLETKQKLIQQAESILQGGSVLSQVTTEWLQGLPPVLAQRLFDLRQGIENEFEVINRLHAESLERLHAQKEVVRKELDLLQNSMAYVQAYHSTLETRPQVDISR